MTHGTSGMRKGISLVEMMIAIILLGVLGIVGIKYMKNKLDVNTISKKARVAALVDQGSQLSNAYDLYQAEAGVAPTTIAGMVDAAILKVAPTPITEIVGANLWTLDTNNTTSHYAGGTTNPDAFTVLSVNITPTVDDTRFCNIFNKDFNNSIVITTATPPVDVPTAITAVGTAGYCFGNGTSAPYKYVIIK